MRRTVGFKLGDFVAQVAHVKCPGRRAKALAQKLGLPQLDDVDIQAQARRMRGIHDAMTAAEREAPEQLDAPRRRRVARGAGVAVTEVSQFIRQFQMSRDMMRRVATMKVIVGVGVVLGLLTFDPLHRDPSYVHRMSDPTRRRSNAAVATTLIVIAAIIHLSCRAFG